MSENRQKGFKERIDHVLPPYARLPLAAVVVLNFLVFFGSRPFTQGLHHYDLSLALDHALPLIPWFSIIYVLAYVQWIVGFIVISREEKDFCYRVLSGEMLSKLMCLAFFVLLPTTIVRPEVTGDDGFCAWLVQLLYRLDSPDNLFPSIHCLESWFCFRGALVLKKTPRWYAPVMLVASLLVFASTLLIKQHVMVDVLGGILVCELGQYLAKRWHTGRILARLCPPWPRAAAGKSDVSGTGDAPDKTGMTGAAGVAGAPDALDRSGIESTCVESGHTAAAGEARKEVGRERH